MASVDKETGASERMQRDPLGKTLGAPARFSGSELLLVLGLSGAACVVLNVVYGRDVNWDFLNYHGYAIFDVFGERLGRDFFPAGYQGYLNRLPFLPHSLLLAAGLDGVVVSSVIALLHALNVFFLYLVSRELCRDYSAPYLVPAAVTLLGACTSVFLLQIGSTFVDPLTTPFILAAMWLVLRAHGWKALFLAGLLAGFAAGLKLTNVTYAVGVAAAVLVSAPTRSSFARAAGAIFVGCALGFVLSHGWWSWKLYALYGSPFFPIFNGLFQAPEFIPYSLRFDRFVPQSLVSALLLPAEMVSSKSWTYTEVAAPDLRPVALVAIFLLALVFRLGKKVHALPSFRATPDARLIVFFFVSWCAWAVTSSNGRYAIPILLLIGPLTYLAARLLFSGHAARVFMITLLVSQAVVVYDNDNQRYGPAVWVGSYFPVTVPQGLREEPLFYISVSKRSHAYLAHHVHPASVFVNPIGLLSLPTDGPGWDRFVSLRESWRGKVRVLFEAGEAMQFGFESRQVEVINGLIDRLGLQFDPSTCEMIVANDLTGYDEQSWPNRWVGEGERAQRLWSLSLAACQALPKPALSPELAERRDLASSIMSAFERRCPDIFYPPLSQTEGGDKVWFRNYGRFDLLLFVNLTDGGVYFSQERQATEVRIGSVGNWAADAEAFRCQLPHGGRRDTSTLVTHEIR